MIRCSTSTVLIRCFSTNHGFSTLPIRRLANLRSVHTTSSTAAKNTPRDKTLSKSERKQILSGIFADKPSKRTQMKRLHAAEQPRDLDWISKPSGKVQYEVLNDLLLQSEDCLYVVDEKFRESVDVAMFELEQKICKTHRQNNNDNGKIWKSFEAEVVKAMRSYKSENLSDVLTLEDLISSTVAKLPLLIHQITATQQPKLISSYFQLQSTPPNEQLQLILLQTYLNHTSQHVSLTASPQQDHSISITNPANWYPLPRQTRRKLILHVGPTNSGKTHNALQRLKSVEKGYFAGPLRLLAREIYERFKSEDIRCNLITGEEIISDLDRFGNQAGLSSGTIEMIDLATEFDCVVLDEIQMIGDKDRGWAWTNALLGVRSKEVHICGEASVVPLVRKIAEMTGDEVVVNKYNRLGELKCEDKPLRGLEDVQSGDCIVVFSKKKILSYKTEIERRTKLKCAVVYGALPAETRVAQAAKFNNGEADVLIATDAIGMGLNLKIRRIIFDDHRKFDGKQLKPIETPQVKQIAGRAGRFKVAPSSRDFKNPGSTSTENDATTPATAADYNVGYVSAFHQGTLNYVKQQLALPSVPLNHGIVWPSDTLWAHYMSSFQRGTPFTSIIQRFSKEVVHQSSDFEVADIENRLSMVGELQKVKGLSVSDQLRISTAPVSSRLPNFEAVIREFCQTVAKSQSKTIFQYEDCLDFTIVSGDLPNPLTTDPNEYKELLSATETLHKFVMVWLWMNIRYPTYFVDRESATDLKAVIEERIEDLIDGLREQTTTATGGSEKKKKNPRYNKFSSGPAVHEGPNRKERRKAVMMDRKQKQKLERNT